MARVYYFESLRGARARSGLAPACSTSTVLPRLLARLIEAGLADVAANVLNAWGREEINHDQALEFCATMAAVAGLKGTAESEEE